MACFVGGFETTRMHDERHSREVACPRQMPVQPLLVELVKPLSVNRHATGHQWPSSLQDMSI